MSSELRRVLIWLTAFVLSLGAAIASRHAGLGDSAIVGAVLKIFGVYSLLMLVFALFNMGGGARPELREGYNVHGLNWGAKGIWLVFAVGMSWPALWFALDKNTIWLWGLAILVVVGALYAGAAAAFYQIVWDDEAI